MAFVLKEFSIMIANDKPKRFRRFVAVYRACRTHSCSRREAFRRARKTSKTRTKWLTFDISKYREGRYDRGTDCSQRR